MGKWREHPDLKKLHDNMAFIDDTHELYKQYEMGVLQGASLAADEFEAVWAFRQAVRWKEIEIQAGGFMKKALGV